MTDKYRHIEVDSDTIVDRLRNHIESASEPTDWILITEAFVALRDAMQDLDEAEDRIADLVWQLDEAGTS